jgi:putative hemolysin
LPNTADACEWEGWRLEVVDMDSTRIDKVLAIPLHNVTIDTPLLEERTP